MKLTRKQKRMRDAVDRLTKYMQTYPSQYKYMDYSDRCFIDDVLYGLGIALEPNVYKGAGGYELFREAVLLPHLRMYQNLRPDVGKTSEASK